MTEKTFKEFQKEYVKKKQSTLDALRGMSVDSLSEHITEYRKFILSYIEENDDAIVTKKVQTHVENQLKQIDSLERVLSQGITDTLVQVMLDEEILMHLVEKNKKDQRIGACCKTSFK